MTSAAQAAPTFARRFSRGAAVLAVLAALVTGCTQIGEIFAPSVPGVSEEWPALLKEIRAFERGFGFQDTKNFEKVALDDDQNPSCGYAPHFYLPYSYEDPGILWRDAVSEQDCLEHADGGDVSFARVEALGEVNAPVTPAIIASKLDRFIYLVIHEDCHDQFELPYGIEEPLCELIAYKAMPAFGDAKYAWGSRAQRAVRQYARQESRRAHETVTYYQQVAALYARYHQKSASADAVMLERAEIFAAAERALGRDPGTMNNVALATDMTYSRHYALMENVFEAMGNDLARTVEFFRHVDKVKPGRTAVMKQQKVADDKSLEFIRAYEAAAVETIEKALAEHKAKKR